MSPSPTRSSTPPLEVVEPCFATPNEVEAILLDELERARADEIQAIAIISYRRSKTGRRYRSHRFAGAAVFRDNLIAGALHLIDRLRAKR